MNRARSATVGESIVNATNCWGPDLCDKVGMRVPVYPMRRLTFYFEVREKLEMMPLTRHISRNVSFLVVSGTSRKYRLQMGGTSHKEAQTSSSPLSIPGAI